MANNTTEPLPDPHAHDCPACCCAPCECCDSDDEPETAEDREPDWLAMLDDADEREHGGAL